MVRQLNIYNILIVKEKILQRGNKNNLGGENLWRKQTLKNILII